jgi:hypothetical protein
VVGGVWKFVSMVWALANVFDGAGDARILVIDDNINTSHINLAGIVQSSQSVIFRLKSIVVRG